MANKLISMQTLRTILQLADRALSGRAIARELGLSRNTVSHYLEQIKASPKPFRVLMALDDEALAALLYPPGTAATGDDERHAPLAVVFAPAFGEDSSLRRSGPGLLTGIQRMY